MIFYYTNIWKKNPNSFSEFGFLLLKLVEIWFFLAIEEVNTDSYDSPNDESNPSFFSDEVHQEQIETYA